MAVETHWTFLQPAYQLTGYTLGFFAVAGHHRDDGAVPLGGNQRAGIQTLLDELSDLPEHLLARIQTKLELLPVKVDDAEHENALMALGVSRSRDVLFRGGDCFPNMVRPAAQRVVAAKPAGGSLEPNSADGPPCGAGRGKGS